MHLRKLEPSDAEGMLEWMKDEKVNRFFRFDPDKITLGSCQKYIEANQNTNGSYHFAIVDDQDNYLGTVSLKDVSDIDRHAEYAISLRSSAQGRGAGTFATREILKFAFDELHLERVFLNVLSDNATAIHLYEKSGFRYEGEFIRHVSIRGVLKNLRWYGINADEYRKGQENGK